jgi:hypothetical protein
MGKPYIFKCPNTGLLVQDIAETHALSDSEHVLWVAVECLGCKQIHLVDQTTGRLLGDED